MENTGEMLLNIVDPELVIVLDDQSDNARLLANFSIWSETLYRVVWHGGEGRWEIDETILQD